MPASQMNGPSFFIGQDQTEVMDFNIPTGVPLVYELDANLRVMQKCPVPV